MIGLLLVLLTAVALGLMVTETSAWVWHLSTRIAKKAAATMPADLASEYHETYLGELETLRDRPLTALVVSFRMLMGSQETVLIQTVGRSPTPAALTVKYLVDVVGGALMALVLAPAILVSIGLVAVSMGRPMVFAQDRIGRHGEPFKLYKLRTMTLPLWGGRTRESPPYPRVPAAGRFLRAVGFDELPQLWNVVKGDMSLVGPRPELPEIVATYDDWQHQRHVVKPGLTGLWQVSDYNGTPMHERIELDMEYIEKLSVAADISILLRTPAAMFHRRGY